MWLARVVAIFTHRTSLLHRISPTGLFYSKTKIRHIFSFHSSFDVLIFTFEICLNDLLFLPYNEQWEQRKMYY